MADSTKVSPSQSLKSQMLDEMPIRPGIGVDGRPKTFDELLEAELRGSKAFPKNATLQRQMLEQLEDEKKRKAQEEADRGLPSIESKQKREFLKKGARMDHLNLTNKTQPLPNINQPARVVSSAEKARPTHGRTQGASPEPSPGSHQGKPSSTEQYSWKHDRAHFDYNDPADEDNDTEWPGVTNYKHRSHRDKISLPMGDGSEDDDSIAAGTRASLDIAAAMRSDNHSLRGREVDESAELEGKSSMIPVDSARVRFSDDVSSHLTDPYGSTDSAVAYTTERRRDDTSQQQQSAWPAAQASRMVNGPTTLRSAELKNAMSMKDAIFDAAPSDLEDTKDLNEWAELKEFEAIESAIGTSPTPERPPRRVPGESRIPGPKAGGGSRAITKLFESASEDEAMGVLNESMRYSARGDRQEERSGPVAEYAREPQKNSWNTQPDGSDMIFDDTETWAEMDPSLGSPKRAEQEADYQPRGPGVLSMRDGVGQSISTPPRVPRAADTHTAMKELCSPPMSNVVNQLFFDKDKDKRKSTRELAREPPRRGRADLNARSQSHRQSLSGHVAAENTNSERQEMTAQKEELEKKTKQLEKEIERYKKDNALLQDEKKKVVAMQKALDEKQRNMDQDRERVMHDFETYKEEEMKKIKRERRVLERQSKVLLKMPDRKERSEVEELKQKLTKANEDLQIRDSKWKLQVDRLKKQLEEMGSRCQEQEQEIKRLEQLRLQNWNMPGSTQEDKGGRQKQQSVALRNHSNKENVDGIKGGHLAASRDDARSVARSGQNSSKTRQTSDVGSSNNNKNNNNNPPVTKYAFGDNGTTATESPVIRAQRGEPRSNRENSDHVDRSGNKMKVSTASSRGGYKSRMYEDSSVRTSEEYYDNTFEEDTTSQDVTGDVVAESLGNVKDGQGDRVVEEIQHEDGKVETLFESGCKVVCFSNGTRKEAYPDGYTAVYFVNGDIKEDFPNGKCVYYYAEQDITHTTYRDGLQIFNFGNSQTERHYPDGTKNITFGDGTIKNIYPNGDEESIFPDGAVQRIDANGTMVYDGDSAGLKAAGFKSLLHSRPQKA